MKTLLLLLLSLPILGSADVLAQICQADFFQDSVTNCPTISLYNTSTASSQILGYYYDFGDGSTSNSMNPSHTYTANGTYQVCLTIFAADSCTSTYCENVYIGCVGQGGGSSCQAGFFQDSITNCPTISLYNTSTASSQILGYYYDFGDGSTSNSMNPSHTYTANGTYQVCLSIFTADSCTSTYCQNVYIGCVGQGGGSSCQAGFFQDSITNCPTISLYNTSTASSQILGYYYDFGDGSTSNSMNPSHTYTANGTYQVCLSIFTADSCTSTYCQNVYIGCVGQGGGSSCQAGFFKDSITNCPTISLYNTSTASSQILGYYYDFGDGSTSNSMNPSHTYAANGTYQVCLSIFTADSCTSTYCENVYIGCVGQGGGSSCQAGFFQDSITNCPTISLYNTSTASSQILGYYYDFGDGSTSNAMNPVHTYTANGVYQVCLTIFAADSCTSTYCQNVYIGCVGQGGGSSCQAGFFQDSITNCPTISLYNTSTASSQILGYYYDFGDGSTSNSMNPSHTYTANGTYQVCLSIFTADSCTSTYCQNVYIGCVGQGGGSSCQAGFFQDSITNCPTISLYNTSTASSQILGYYYDFGDGSTSNAMNPVHTYSANGVYQVCLTIFAADSCTSTYCQNVYIGCMGQGGSCQAAFYQDSITNCPSVTLSDGSVSATQILSYYYDFGDGFTSTLMSPTHSYNANGTYVACLTITTADSCISTFCETIVMNCIAGIQEQAEDLVFSLSPNPAGDHISLNMPESMPVRYRIYGLNGQMFGSDDRPESVSHQIDLQGLSSGVYLLEIESGDTHKVLRFMRQ